MIQRIILFAALIGFSIACTKNDEPKITNEGDGIDQAIDQVNADIVSKNLNIKPLTKDHFLKWFNEFVRFVPLKEERARLSDEMAAGKIPDSCSLIVQNNSSYGLPSTINFEPYNLPVTEGLETLSYLEWLEKMLVESTGNLNLAREPFNGTVPFDAPPTLDPNIQIRVTQIEVPGECLIPGYEERDALKIEVLTTAQNSANIASYFATGFNKQTMAEKLLGILGTQSEKWVDIKALFPNWLSQNINTFPVDGENEVCHGAAREFYYTDQDPALNASTEATTLLLANYYCEVTDSQTLTFGDYLYIPGMHSGRYMLKDPSSGRHIGFSVQSGGNAPYRFWWIDEDFSGNPFARTPKQNLFSTTIDIWRRCK